MLDKEDREGRKGGRTAQSLWAPQSLAKFVSTPHMGNDGHASSVAWTGPSGNEISMPFTFLASAAVSATQPCFASANHVFSPQQQPTAAGGGRRVKLTATVSRGCTTGGAMGLSRVQTLPAHVAGQTNMDSRHTSAGNQTQRPVHDNAQRPVHEASVVREEAAVSPGPGAEQAAGTETGAVVHGAAGMSWQSAASCPARENKGSVPKEKRAVSSYNIFLKHKVEELKATIPIHRDRFKEAARLWREQRNTCEQHNTSALPAHTPGETDGTQCSPSSAALLPERADAAPVNSGASEPAPTAGDQTGSAPVNGSGGGEGGGASVPAPDPHGEDAVKTVEGTTPGVGPNAVPGALRCSKKHPAGERCGAEAAGKTAEGKVPDQTCTVGTDAPRDQQQQGESGSEGCDAEDADVSRCVLCRTVCDRVPQHCCTLRCGHVEARY